MSKGIGFKPLGARVLVEKYKDTSKNEITILGIVTGKQTQVICRITIF